MRKFIKHTGVAAPLRHSNVDTDQIIPASFLKRITKTGFEDGLFASWRKDPEFVLNQPAFAKATILVAGSDFGTGSSREHAVWALRDYGFRVVLSSKFADIFRNNSEKDGLLTGIISEADCIELWQILENNPGLEITVDLQERTVLAADFMCKFEIDAYARWRLMEGLDDIALTLKESAAITDFEAKRPSFKPQTLPAKQLPPVPMVSARAIALGIPGIPEIK